MLTADRRRKKPLTIKRPGSADPHRDVMAYSVGLHYGEDGRVVARGIKAIAELVELKQSGQLP